MAVQYQTRMSRPVVTAGEEMVFKVLLIGNSGVGKSCILMRFAENLFTNDFYNTIGVDFKVKHMLVEGRKVKLQLWDTAGQDRFRTITSSYYRGANGIIIVYDITDRESFQNVKNWYSEMSKNTNDNVVKVLIGNKLDMEENRKVSYAEGLELGQEFGLPFLQTSAKNSINISKLFDDLTSRMIQLEEEDPEYKSKIRLRPPQISEPVVQSSNCCC